MAATAPIEVLAAIQCLSTTDCGHALYRSSGTLSPSGIPAEGAGSILAFLALTFAIQNLVVARRTLWAPRSSIGATA